MSATERIRAALLAEKKDRELSTNKWAQIAGVSESGLRDFFSGKAKSPTVDFLEKVIGSIGMSLSDFPGWRPEIAIVGIVGAGEEIYPFDDAPVGGGIDMIPAPPGIPLDSVAVQVRGDSMFNAYWDGDILAYHRDGPFDRASCLYNDCIVKVIDGPTFLKRLAPGSTPNLFNLESYNAPILRDQAIEWASPVLYHDKSRRGKASPLSTGS